MRSFIISLGSISCPLLSIKYITLLNWIFYYICYIFFDSFNYDIFKYFSGFRPHKTCTSLSGIAYFYFFRIQLDDVFRNSKLPFYKPDRSWVLTTIYIIYIRNIIRAYRILFIYVIYILRIRYKHISIFIIYLI